MKLIITKLKRKQTTYIASSLYQDRRLIEINLEPEDKKSILGNIYIGRVKNVVRNLNAAFIEIAPGMSCYYPLEDMKSPLFVKKINSPRMVQGDEVVVQVAKESSKSKPPKVSTNINITGKYLVLTSESTLCGISKKLDAEKRKELRNTLEFDANRDFGVIVRTNAAPVSKEVILAEYEALKQELYQLRETAPHRTVFSCLKENVPEYLLTLKNMNEAQLEEILTDDHMLYRQIQNYLEQFQPEDSGKLSFYEDNLLSLNKLYSVETRLKEALQEKVWLKSGGYLVIQPTEALTSIDVNSGKNIEKKKVQEHYFHINAEAAVEVAHQIRLRNISGIIIIDFIDMESEKSKTKLMQVLREAVRYDSVPVQVVDMTPLNLVEMTRKKIRKPLTEQINIM